MTYPLTVKVTQWEMRPHPQVPGRGDAINFGYRSTKTEPLPDTMVELAVCAVDSAKIVLLCSSIIVHDTPGDPWVEEGDSWIGAGSEMDLSATAGVVLLPDQLRGGLHPPDDPKDGDGYVPPLVPAPGDRLRLA
ncbi:hypothetical protein [Streptomyces sp. NPDC002328]|uniref:hypothetical protein n=1 Tax=Streptomyces sp. NPDC002328 TaxID=3364642 RepID=UPI00368E2256